MATTSVPISTLKRNPTPESNQSGGLLLTHSGIIHQNVSLVQPAPVSHETERTNTTAIVVGVVVPLIVIGIFIVVFYFWYRRKYPVRMVIGKDFAKFSNPAYNTRASTLTLVRDDGQTEWERMDSLSNTTVVFAETQGDDTDLQHNIPFEEIANGDETLEKRYFVAKRNDLSLSCQAESNNDHEQIKKAVLIKSNETTDTDNGFDCITELDFGKSSESDVSSNNDSTGTHTISLCFAETFDSRLEIKANINFVESTNKDDENNSAIIEKEISQLNESNITDITQESNKHEPEDKCSFKSDPNIYENTNLALASIESTNSDLLVVAGPVDLQTQRESLVGKQCTEVTTTDQETVEYLNENHVKNNMEIPEDQNVADDLKDNSNASAREISCEPQMPPENSTSYAMLKRGITAFSTEKNLYLEPLPSPTVFVQDSIMFEPDPYHSQIFIDKSHFSPKRSRRAFTMNDIPIIKPHGSPMLSLERTDGKSVSSPDIYDNEKLGKTDRSNTSTPIGNNQEIYAQENTLESNSNEQQFFEGRKQGEDEIRNPELINILNNSNSNVTTCENQVNYKHDSESLAISVRHGDSIFNVGKAVDNEGAYHEPQCETKEQEYNNNGLSEMQFCQLDDSEFSLEHSNLETNSETSVKVIPNDSNFKELPSVQISVPSSLYENDSSSYADSIDNSGKRKLISANLQHDWNLHTDLNYSTDRKAQEMSNSHDLKFLGASTERSRNVGKLDAGNVSDNQILENVLLENGSTLSLEHPPTISIDNSVDLSREPNYLEGAIDRQNIFTDDDQDSSELQLPYDLHNDVNPLEKQLRPVDQTSSVAVTENVPNATREVAITIANNDNT